MDKDKLDKIIELLEAIRANQEANQFHYYPPYPQPSYPHRYYPQPYIPNTVPSYPQPNWTNPAVGTGGNIYQC